MAKPKQSPCEVCDGLWNDCLLHTIMSNNGVYRRLCTDCLLHDEENRRRQYFCPVCLNVFNDSEPIAFILCSICSSFAHLHCSPPPPPSPTSSYSVFTCPSCSDFKFSFFKRKHLMDLSSAKALVIAVKKAMDNLKEAATLLEKEAYKKALESVMAKRRAKEALETLMDIQENFGEEQ